MSSSDDSSEEYSVVLQEEESKMNMLMQEWDEKSDDDVVFNDSDDDATASQESRRKHLLSKEKNRQQCYESSSEEESEDESVISDASEEESEYEEDVVSDDGGEEIKKRIVVSPDTDDDGSVVDDGNLDDTLKKKTKTQKSKVKVAPLTAPSKGDSEEDADMKKLLASWTGDEEGDEGDNSDSNSDDENDSVSEREVVLDDNVLDHIVLAAPDLEQAMSDFQRMTGIEAVVAATIKGLGIKSARISFNDASYIEIIAPDPKSPGPIGQLLKTRGIKQLTPFHFAIRSSRAEDLKTEVKQFGYVPDHITMFGTKKDGTVRKWEMLFLYGHRLGGVCPFFINWANSDHPCAKLPVVGKLKKFTIRAPQEDSLHKLLEHIDVQGINVEVGEPKISFQFSSPEGTIKFATDKATGFKFPGFEGEDGGDEEYSDSVVFDNFESPELLQVNDADDYAALPPPSY